MSKDVLISIKGIQIVDGEKDVVEITTVGTMVEQDQQVIFTYMAGEEPGEAGELTTLCLDKQANRVSMCRNGNGYLDLCIERGVRHQSIYDTGFGELLIGVSGKEVSTAMDDEGGSIKVKYTLDINAAVASENEVQVSVRKFDGALGKSTYLVTEGDTRWVN